MVTHPHYLGQLREELSDPLLEILLPGLTIQGVSTNRTGSTERDKKY